MKHWYIKEFSQLTEVSVRTLHHYDRVNLLKPSLRLDNGYRLYSEKDLLRLQQIIALKFFGFELSHIKKLLANPSDVFEQLSMQSGYLQEKVETLTEASRILKHIISECSHKKSIPWKQTIQLIEVYRMTQKLENAWVKNVLDPEELKQYAEFEKSLKARSTEEEKAEFEKNWFNLIDKISNSLQNDPRSEMSIQLAKQCLEMTKHLYGKENMNLRKTLWEKGFKEGKQGDAHGFTPEIVKWLDQAMDAYWRNRIYSFLAQVGKLPSSELVAGWNEILEDLYGDQTEPKTALFEAVMVDEQVSQEAKDWLKKQQSL